MKKFFIVILVCLNSQLSLADVIFEGYSKVQSQGMPLGFAISKYEFNPKDKKFYSTYFLKTNTNLAESLKAVADAELNPISYEYTSIVGKESKIIDAKFVKGKMSAVINVNGKKTKIDKKIPQGVFLSTFLYYIMLKSPSGLKVDTTYNFKAIAEEDADIFDGSAAVIKPEKYRGLDSFKVINTFKKIKYTSWITDRGEILGTDSSAQGITTEVVSFPMEATQGISFSSNILKSLFGEIPEGLENAISKKAKPASLEDRPKTDPVEDGKGIQIKAQPIPSNKNNKSNK